MSRIKLKSHISAYISCDICGRDIEIADNIKGIVSRSDIERKIDLLVNSGELRKSGDHIICKQCIGHMHKVDSNITYLPLLIDEEE